MRSKRGKRKAVPAIVPRFLKSAVTIGVIPAIACGPSHPRMQPVVAYMATPAPGPDEASVTPNLPNPPVVAAYQQPPPPPPVVAAFAVDAHPVAPPIDAGVDAPKKKATKVDPKRPPPPVVAAMMPKP
jgi:hypothetical protein